MRSAGSMFKLTVETVEVSNSKNICGTAQGIRVCSSADSRLADLDRGECGGEARGESDDETEREHGC